MSVVIGILGGMGPRATVQFEQRLLDKLPGTDQQLPTIVCINDGSVPDRSNFLLGIGRDPVPQLRQNALALQRLGATVICMPCNSACMPIILRRVQWSVEVPIIDLPACVVAQLTCTRVLLLATAGTVRSGCYQALCKEQGIDCVVPPPQQQELVSQVIQAVKADDQPVLGTLLPQLKQYVAQANVQAVILGCTELPLVADNIISPDQQAIDTLDVLVDEAVAYTNDKKEKFYDTRYLYA